MLPFTVFAQRVSRIVSRGENYWRLLELSDDSDHLSKEYFRLQCTLAQLRTEYKVNHAGNVCRVQGKLTR